MFDSETKYYFNSVIYSVFFLSINKNFTVNQFFYLMKVSAHVQNENSNSILDDIRNQTCYKNFYYSISVKKLFTLNAKLTSAVCMQ